MSSSKVHASFIEPLMTIFAVVRNNPDDRIQEVAEIIAELRDPMKMEASDAANGKASDSLEEMETESNTESKAERDKREELQRKKQVIFIRQIPADLKYDCPFSCFNRWPLLKLGSSSTS